MRETPVPVDSQQFKAAMSQWGSGVSIITTWGAAGEPIGFTASSFCSLSLQPPMVLFCLGRDSTNFDAFLQADAFAVNILAAVQKGLSQRFAGKGCDKFEGVDHHPGAGGAPLLPGSLACLECRVREKRAVGDHVIFMGEVEHISLSDGAPLLYFRGQYHGL